MVAASSSQFVLDLS